MKTGSFHNFINCNIRTKLLGWRRPMSRDKLCRITSWLWMTRCVTSQARLNGSAAKKLVRKRQLLLLGHVAWRHCTSSGVMP